MPVEFELPNGGKLNLRRGDITRWRGDVIVNAANQRMLGGGGVDGAIHRAAGPELLAACEAIREVSPGVRCPTGEARITPAFGRLQCRHVIHTVGPVYQNAQRSAPQLAAAYENSLALAVENGLETIAFPAISCGVYRYPLDEAAGIALQTCWTHCGPLKSITFVLFGDETFDAWTQGANHVSS